MCMYACSLRSLYVCMYSCTYNACMTVCLYVCMSVCMFACMQANMYNANMHFCHCNLFGANFRDQSKLKQFTEAIFILTGLID